MFFDCAKAIAMNVALAATAVALCRKRRREPLAGAAAVAADWDSIWTLDYGVVIAFSGDEGVTDACGGSGGRADGLPVHVLVEGVQRVVAAEARLLEAAEGRRHVAAVVAVDPDDTCAQSLRCNLR